MSSSRRLALFAAVLVLVTGLAGCGLGTAGGRVLSGELAGPVADVERLDGVEIAVGSKNFTEQIILGKMAVSLLSSAGADVEDLTNIPGSAAAREAQVQGQVDATWDYTGTGWITYLGHDEPIADSHEQYVAVRDEDKEVNDLDWLPPAPMNNTYGMAVTEDTKKKYGITKLSDLKDIPVAERTFCVESEFANRPDGMPGMLETYGIPQGDPKGVPRDNVKTYQTGSVYSATSSGKCNFGEVFTTDGRIKSLGLTVLEDDKHYFPNYNVSFILRGEVLREHPQIAELFAPVSEKLTNEVLTELNAEVDVEGREPVDVAYDWLVEEGFLTD